MQGENKISASLSYYPIKYSINYPSKNANLTNLSSPADHPSLFLNYPQDKIQSSCIWARSFPMWLLTTSPQYLGNGSFLPALSSLLPCTFTKCSILEMPGFAFQNSVQVTSPPRNLQAFPPLNQPVLQGASAYPVHSRSHSTCTVFIMMWVFLRFCSLQIGRAHV